MYFGLSILDIVVIVFVDAFNNKISKRGRGV